MANDLPKKSRASDYPDFRGGMRKGGPAVTEKKNPMSCHVCQDRVTVPRPGGSEHMGLRAYAFPRRCVPLSTAGRHISMGSSHECGDHALARGNPVNIIRLCRSLFLKPKT